ncbi:MAG: cytochrome c biogenesis protein CcdA [Bradyrhizobium sp.]|uniref:Sulfite exporter TauE/SafE family protein n=3 Tax=Bradyrhizobium TaxID=374 RepID=A0ABS5GEQ3_9BRAD|nr:MULTISPECIES: cytochrome c biogenesis protein CcdA [Bradyrhizobium]RTL97649.1 MAG: cytochrome C biogenesis protein CcdA [Bradyrhizobiaceae bacterium]ABQ35748.1 putative transmembrane cytochrome C biogenesis protein, putative SoxV protein [Bradyrhizobium sp. BTAi1]MBR1139660.1 sulfite exporter TauE/SafE family protein [Bradyrhizobium denitrificans]MCL8484318.1 cytochrome c biogenesis protein CcdA [Bradyrhizobium denitrificans]MDU1495336.1 cytochrome c biogenesis protein CcdA [Bradyrhizobium 
MDLDVTLGAALAAGLLSFLSPCILPLVPPFLCYMAGVSAAETVIEAAPVPRRRTVLTALCFVAGFSLVFVGLGATASVFGRFIAGHLSQLGLVAGLVIIMMGLHFLGLLRIPLLYRSATIDVGRKPAGLLGAFVMGLAFAFGWTPCAGPVLAAVLMMAGAEATVAKGALLLAAYSLGTGIPFLIAAAFMSEFMTLLKGIKPHLALVEKTMGGFLVLTGAAFLTGVVPRMSEWIFERFPSLATIG